MPSPNDVVDAMEPALSVGERVSLRVPAGGAAREVIGFVTALSGVGREPWPERPSARSRMCRVPRSATATG